MTNISDPVTIAIFKLIGPKIICHLRDQFGRLIPSAYLTNLLNVWFIPIYRKYGLSTDHQDIYEVPSGSLPTTAKLRGLCRPPMVLTAHFA